MSDRYTDLPSFDKKTLAAPIKRIAAIHDISCFGRCALTVIIPTLSALGFQVVPLPTALLSTHTGGFEDMFFEDLTAEMANISSHWENIGLDFDAVYTGFLGSEAQIEFIRGFISDFRAKNDKTKAFIAVDPVMGDDGELYSTYTPELAHGMKRLCVGADLITPNITEACLLADEKYPTKLSPDEVPSFAEHICERLCKLFGVKNIVVTGIDDGLFVSTASRNESGRKSIYKVDRMPRSYPGTGDVFASVLIGRLLSGESLDAAVKTACDFILRVTVFSSGYRTPIRDGLVIEPCLGELTRL